MSTLAPTTIGGAELWHGDCLDLLERLAGIDALIADPPYGINLDKLTGTSRNRWNTTRRTNEYDFKIIGDDQPFDPRPFLRYPKVVLFGGNHFNERLPGSSCWLIWDKRDGGTSDHQADCEINRLQGGRWYDGPEPILSTNIALRNDGLPRAGLREPEDSGVAVYFEYRKKTMVFACDKYQKVWENMVAIRKTIEAIRGMERWGASDMMERAFQGFTALPDHSGGDWWVVLGVPEHAPADVVEQAYRRLRSLHHPDRGGDASAFNEVQRAFEQWRMQS